MPQLFVLPRQVPLNSAAALLAGATLDFYITATSTRQNVYTDIALTVAATNPLVADSNGVFPKAYYDPTLPNYRVVLKTQGGVTLYTEDDIPSNETTTQTSRLVSTAPSIIFKETDGSLNNKVWKIGVNSEQFIISILNDAESIETVVATIDRTGTSLDSVNFLAAPFIQGERISAHLLAFKSSAEDKSTNTVTAADLALHLALEASSTYLIEVSVLFTGITTGAQGLKYVVSYSGSLSTTASAQGYKSINGASTVTAPFTATSPNSFGTISTSSTLDGMVYTFIIQTNTAGTLSFDWAQSSSNANATRVALGSWLSATRLG